MAKKSGSEKFRYRLIYKVAHLIAPRALRKYSFQTDKMPKVDFNYIVLANHLTEDDVVMAFSAFPEHMYIVAGEHLLRSKNAKKIVWSQNPIFRYKGANGFDMIREVLARTANGSNILLYPEGSRSFNGETVTLNTSTASLVKKAGCGLVTYHMEGGYFVAPRWAYTVRRGPVKGEIRHILSPEEVAAMSKQELADLINKDIYENAYETQRKNRYRYEGERLAEGLENYLVVCSKCGAVDSMKSEGEKFWCEKCGQAGVYTPEGFLAGEGLAYDSVYDWGKWSEEQLCERIRAEEDPEKAQFNDDEITVYEILKDHTRVDLYSGSVSGFAERIEAGEHVFSFSDITGMDMLYFGKTLLFSWQGRHMGITGEHFHAIKYQKLYDVYKEKKR